MMRPSTRRTWLVVLGVAAASGYWLFSGGRESPPAPTYSPTKPAERSASSALAPPTQNSAPSEGTSASGSSRVASAANATPGVPSDGAKAGSNPKFGFQLPPTATVGEALDLNIVIESGQDIGRIVIEVKYDPAILRARSAEEVDYANREPNERMLHLQQMNEGHIVAVLRVDPTTAPLTSHSAGVVQFEAIAHGWGRVDVSKIAVSDRQNGPLPWSADSRALQVAVQ